MRFVGFAIVGGLGFVVDGGVLTILSQLLHVDVYLSRCVSFSLATLVTWLLNRTFVFVGVRRQSDRRAAEYASYFSVQIVGALTNLSVFVALISSRPSLQAVPVIPLAVGAVFGLVINYLGAKYLVFGEPDRRRQ